ncbi:MAG: hypothetical protein ACRDY4_16355 [Acidimicrobiia bacterium]
MVQGEAMSHPSTLLVVVSASVFALLAGCDSGGDDADAGPPRRSAPETTSTTAAPAGIDLSEPIPGGSLHGTPRPPLENTGDDYVAIFESLMANVRWLSENPDPAVLSELYVPGTPGHDERVPAYEFLVANGYRWADEGYQLISVEVVDAQSDIVSLQVQDRLEYERLLDTAGNQVGEARERGTAQTYTALLAVDGEGRWRVADANRAGDEVVEL